MTIIFDKNTTSERSLEVDYVTENLVDHQLVCGYERPLANAQPQDLSGFSNNSFTTIEVRDGERVLPLQGNYSSIAALQTNYYSSINIYSLSLVAA